MTQTNQSRLHENNTSPEKLRAEYEYVSTVHLGLTRLETVLNSTALTTSTTTRKFPHFFESPEAVRSITQNNTAGESVDFVASEQAERITEAQQAVDIALQPQEKVVEG